MRDDNAELNQLQYFVFIFFILLSLSFLFLSASLAGIFFILPCIDTYARVDLRTRTYDVPPQELSIKPNLIDNFLSFSFFCIITYKPAMNTPKGIFFRSFL